MPLREQVAHYEMIRIDPFLREIIRTRGLAGLPGIRPAKKGVSGVEPTPGTDD